MWLVTIFNNEVLDFIIIQSYILSIILNSSITNNS